MKSTRLVFVLVLLLVAGGAGVYLVQVGPMGVRVVQHELKIGELEKRATSAEHELADHEKRIAVLESSVSTLGKDLAKTQADLGATRIELEQAQEKLEHLDGRIATAELDRTRLADEVAALKKKVEALEKDLVKRVEVLEKLNEGKLQR